MHSPAGNDIATRHPDLPGPVRTYLQRALGAVARPIRHLRMHQCGTLRSAPTGRWMRFRAIHEVDPVRRCFSWDARVRLAPLLGLHVHDAYAHGVGSGRVRLLGFIGLGSDRGSEQINAAALHRFLAEAVWYPTALLPSPGLAWSPIDDRTALATLSDSGISVSLEFRFDAAGDVASVYTPARWRRVGRGYQPTPWEGRFAGFGDQHGLRMPARGEVGWTIDGSHAVLWKGAITRVECMFDGTPA